MKAERNSPEVARRRSPSCAPLSGKRSPIVNPERAFFNTSISRRRIDHLTSLMPRASSWFASSSAVMSTTPAGRKELLAGQDHVEHVSGFEVGRDEGEDLVGHVAERGRGGPHLLGGRIHGDKGSGGVVASSEMCVLSTSHPRNRFSFLGACDETRNQPLRVSLPSARAPNPIDGKLRLLRRLLWSRREG